MKKIVLIMVMLLVGSCSYAACGTSTCAEPRDLTSKTSRFFSKVTGQNFLGEKVGESLTKKAIKDNIISGDIKIDLKSYSVRDLKAGRFKSLEISGTDVNVENIYITSFTAKTLCDFNYIVWDKKGNVTVMEDIPAYFRIEISEDDLNKTMDTPEYKKMLSNINKVGGSLNVFQINSAGVRLKDGRMYYVLKYTLPFVGRTQELVMNAKLSVEDGKIVLGRTNVVDTNILSNSKNFSNLLSYINPLDFSSKILENKDAKINVQNINIADGKISISGKMTILKDKE